MSDARGGESAKLGDYYEGIWTVDSLLDLLSGEALSLQPEPLDRTEGEGIEFIKVFPEGEVEYHSAKRQKPGLAWSLADLARVNPNGRSVLGDLFLKLARGRPATAAFVSQTGANQLRELCERARRCSTLAEWKERIKEPKALAEAFENCILPLCGNDQAVALERLKRLRATSIDEQELLKRTEQKIAQWVYRPDGDNVDSGGVRRLLAEFVTNHLGQAIGRSDVLTELNAHGFCLRIWGGDASLMARVDALNESYLRPIWAQIIGRKAIPRTEAKLALDRLTSPGGQKAQLIVGSAGLGKTCVVVEIVEELLSRKVPTICLRLDSLPHLLTTQNLGRELDLPGSPVIVLAGIANGGPCVLAIDQLDALSVVSGRNDHLWPVFHLLLAEAERVPNMRLLLACRSFDLQHDKRLSDLAGEGHLAARIDLSLLGGDQVAAAIRAAGGVPEKLSQQQMELLRNPFNLHLFLEASPATNASFNSLKDLFDRFWDCKASAVAPFLRAPDSWENCITTLAQALSTGSTSAPLDVLDRFSQEAKVLASHGVLVLEHRRWRFFHETFSDYAFARQFAREGRDLVQFLLNGEEQHLFRRAQTRQILAYERDRDRKAYIVTLKHLISGPRIRLHLKKLALEWLSQLHDPGKDEWQLVQSFLHDPELGIHAASVLWDKLPWFDLLNELSVWPSLLKDEAGQMGLRLTTMFAAGSILQERSDAVAKLFAPYLAEMPGANNRFRLLFQFGHAHHSREMFDLTLACIEAGVFDEFDHSQSLLVHEMAKARPDYMAEFLGKVLDRLCALAHDKGESNPFRDSDGAHLRTAERAIPAHEIRSAAEKAPAAFAEQIAPRLVRLIQRSALPEEDGRIKDGIWRFITLGAEHDTEDALLFSTACALRKLAAENPDAAEKLTRDWLEAPHHTIQFLLLQTWSGHGAAFADVAAVYLIGNPRALTIGYEMTIGTVGNPIVAVSRELLQAIGPHCSAELHARLEEAIFALGTSGTGEEAQRNRYTELLLLRALELNRLSSKSRTRCKELEAEFPQIDIALPRVVGAIDLARPVPEASLDLRSDQDWLALLNQCAVEQSPSHSQQARSKLYEVLGPLAKEAKADRRRFAGLSLQMGDEIPPVCFTTILDAIALNDGAGKGDQPKQPLEADLLSKVILRLHSLPNRPCGTAICNAIYSRANLEYPPEVLEAVCYYAVHDPDPGPGKETGDGEQLVNHAINTVRGRAADAIARLLFSNPGLAERFLPTIESLAQDSCACIRAVTIHPLVALLNRDRGSAVRIFLQICATDSRIWSSHHIEDFIYYATYTHYTELKSLLRQMLAGSNVKAKAKAARQICLVAFQHPEAEADLAAVLAGDTICRQSAAEVYSQNHLHLSVRSICEQRLLPLLNDAEREVRGVAEHWIIHFKAITAAGDWTFFQQYLDTISFAEEPGMALHQLREILGIPPDIVLRIATRAIELSKRDASEGAMKALRFASYTPTLLVRLYHQADDPTLKTHCLDLLDGMIALGWNEASSEIAKAERC